MAKNQLSNTEKAAINTLIDLGNSKFSYFDSGIVEGSGIWYDAMRDEMPYSSTLSARAITRMVKDGYLVKTEDATGDDGPWIELTSKGAAAALAVKDDQKLEIVEEAAAPTTRKAPTAQVAEGTGCKCGCGTQVQGKKAHYRPGHDAKHVSRLVAETKTTGKQPKETSVLSPRLFAKYVAAVSK